MIKQITLITNICFEPYLRIYIKERFSPLYNNIRFDSVSYEEYKYNIDNIRSADIIVICLNFEELYPNISNDVLSKKTTYDTTEKACIYKCRELYSYLKANSNASIVWFGFEDYYCHNSENYGSLIAFNGLVGRLNFLLIDILKEVSFIDFERLIATVGIKNAYDSKGKYRWNAPYSKELIRLMVEEVYKQHLIAMGITKKCLVLDCDNVIWGGTLSEDGIEGIQIDSSGLGRPFQDFQKYLLDLFYHGVILTVCSKNDKADVLKVFQEHSGMLLKEEHISCFCCNWNNKSDNIKAISESLNIGLDSMVFVDDSHFEIESVKHILPDVTTILYQRDRVYDELSCFNLKTITDMQIVKERTNTYKTNILREEIKNNASTFDEYISSLNMKIDIHKTLVCELARVSELTQRTNKCTNGIRYTIDQLRSHMENTDYELYTVCLSDRFSNLGVVGVMGINGKNIDLFSLSCRALGRNVELDMVKYMLQKDATSVRYIDTSKNETTRNLFEANNFIFV